MFFLKKINRILLTWSAIIEVLFGWFLFGCKSELMAEILKILFFIKFENELRFEFSLLSILYFGSSSSSSSINKAMISLSICFAFSFSNCFNSSVLLSPNPLKKFESPTFEYWLVLNISSVLKGHSHFELSKNNWCSS